MAGLVILFGGVMMSGSDRHVAGMAPVALAAGAIILAGGVFLMVAPRKHETAGTVLIVASAVALFAYGWSPPTAFGVALGIAAGIVAVQWEAPVRVQR
jgi:hypothetical protein